VHAPPYILAAAALTLLWAGPARADALPWIRYLDTDIASIDKDMVVVRGAFEITSRPHCWYTVSFQLQLDEVTPLRKADGRPLWVEWAHLFTPDNLDSPGLHQQTRWTDCRAGFYLKDIAAAANLPRGQRTIVWAVGYLYDQTEKKFQDSGWYVRTPLILTTDEAGGITRTETFHTVPADVGTRGNARLIPVREMKLGLRDLRLKPGTKLYQGVEQRGRIHEMAVLEKGAADLRGIHRGYFFNPIDSPEKAQELITIAYPDGVVVQSAAQYQQIVAALKAIKGWDALQFLPVERPAAYGMKVAEVPGLGYRVTALMIDRERREGQSAHYRNVTLREWNVSADGRLSLKETVCIRCPVWHTGYPAMWLPEFPPQDRVPGQIGPPPNLNSALQAYDAAIKDALARGVTWVMPNTRTVTTTTARISQPGDVRNADPFVEPKR
jgi:hypothetical protein